LCSIADPGLKLALLTLFALHELDLKRSWCELLFCSDGRDWG